MRRREDRLYEIVFLEVERNEFDGVAKALAFEEAEGDEKKARAYYTKHRVRRLRDDLIEQSIIAEGKNQLQRASLNEAKKISDN